MGRSGTMLRANGCHAREARLHERVPEGADDVKTDDDDHVLPAMNEGDYGHALGVQGRAALHRAAAARPPKPRLDEAARNTASVEPSTHAADRPRHCRIASTSEMDNRRFMSDRHRQDRRPFPDAALPSLRRVRLHRRARRRARRRCRAARKSEPIPPSKLLEALRQGSAERREERRRASRCDGRARSAPIPCPGKPMSVRMGSTARSCRSAPRTTRRSRSSQACVPARRWTDHDVHRALEAACSRAHAPTGRPTAKIS